MEPLWSPVIATGGNQWQTGLAPKARKQAESVAVGCDRLPEKFHGKEGVDGSSPSEGSEKLLQMPTLSRFTVAATGDEGRTWPRYTSELRFAASEKPCKADSCTTLSMPIRLRGKEGVAGTGAVPTGPVGAPINGERSLPPWLVRSLRAREGVDFRAVKEIESREPKGPAGLEQKQQLRGSAARGGSARRADVLDGPHL
jgi:hypothetical protein